MVKVIELSKLCTLNVFFLYWKCIHGYELPILGVFMLQMFHTNQYQWLPYMPKLVLVYICTPTPSTLTLMHSRFYKSQLENMQESFVSTLYLLFRVAATWQKREYNNLPITLKLFLLPRFMEISSNRNLIFYFYIWNMESWQLLIRIWIVKPNKQMKRRRKM